MRKKKRIPSSVFALAIASVLGIAMYNFASSSDAPAIQKVIEYKEKAAPTTMFLLVAMKFKLENA